MDVPTGLLAASPNKALAEFVQDAFMSDVLRIYTSDDPVGAELGAALKNVIALCAGVTDGLGYGDNTKAMLMTRGLTEVARLGVALGARKETFTGLAGVGDLIVTCTSMHSRNRRAGILIGQGRNAQQAMEEVGAVVEGYYAAKSAYFLGQKMGVDMPITEAAYQVLYEGASAAEAVKSLLLRSRRTESENPGWL
jgi:glycerol-3-phosphate dehydrogenase (NAD(P)+)